MKFVIVKLSAVPFLIHQDPVHKNLLLWFKRPYFKTIENNRQYYCFIYFNFHIFREKSRRQKCLDWIITWISCFKSRFLKLWKLYYEQILFKRKKIKKTPEMKSVKSVAENTFLDLKSSEDVPSWIYTSIYNMTRQQMTYCEVESV